MVQETGKMIFPRPLVDATKQWSAQDVLSKCLIAISLLLVLFAYLPTLQFDYVTQDQWRAFRYSTEEQTPYDRAKACIKMIPQLYALTGRPLVWITECVEHATVAKISDFIYLRPIVLFIALITAVYLGVVLAPIVGGLAMGVMTASTFLMAPGYSFMYLQSMPAAMVLISIILATASFSLLKKRLDQEVTKGFKKIKLWTPFFLFLSSCLIYPSWAFLVIPLTWIAFGFDQNNSWLRRIKRFCSALLFYFFAAVFYYIIVKIIIFIVLKLTGHTPHLGSYEFAMQLSPNIILERTSEAAKYLYEMPPLNFDAPHGLLMVVLGFFSVKISWDAYKSKSVHLLAAIAFSVLIFVIGWIILLASISPWLFSRMESLGTRHLIPWYLFFCAASAGLIFTVVKTLPQKLRRLAPIFTLFVCVIPAAAIQNKLTFLETAVSGIEIENMRLRLGEWLDKKGYLNNRYILVVSPVKERPAFVEELFGEAKNAGENAVLSSSKNPVSIPWMVNALLRERTARSAGKSIEIVDCGFDQVCASGILADSTKVALGITYGDVPIQSTEKPFIINNSTLTSKPINPIIEHIALPRIKASSQMGSYGPQGLLSQMQPGWHAERNPKYPQTLMIDFHKLQSFGTIGLLPQDENSVRAPKSIRIKVSNDGKSWVTAASSNDICVANASGGWHNVKLTRPVRARFLEVDIFSNCGDQDFLTLRGLRVE